MKTMKTVKFEFSNQGIYEEFVGEILNELKQDIKDHPELGSVIETDTEIILKVDRLSALD